MPSRTSFVRFSPLPFFSSHLHHPDALLIMGKTLRDRSRSVLYSPAWPKGVCPRSWPRAMASVRAFIHLKGPGDGPGDLGDLQRVGEPASGNGLLPEPETPGSYASNGGTTCCGGSGPGPSDRPGGYHRALPPGPVPGSHCLRRHRDLNFPAPTVPWIL